MKEIQRQRRWPVWAAALLGALVILAAARVVARASDRRSQNGPARRLSEAPESARRLRNPYAVNQEAIEAGGKLFRDNCAECHGYDALGREHAADLRSPAVQNAPPGSLFWAIRNGRIRKGMPSWSRLPDQQIWQIVTYVHSLGPSRAESDVE
jgi:mono/diheme cytochrome c family protein